MRPSSVTSEAWRNLRTGTTRAWVFALALLVLAGGVAVVDVQGVVGVERAAQEFRASGATILQLSGAEADGARCAVLGEVDGIVASGALRAGPTTRALALPSQAVDTYEGTTGIGGVLGVRTAGPGVLVSEDLAAVLDVEAGSTLTTSRGVMDVAGVFAYPDDGRDRMLGYAIVEPVPATGTFETCWARTWPTDEVSAGYLRTAALPSQDPPRVVQLNSTLGTSFEPQVELADRATAQAPWIAIAIGLVLGAFSVRVRRLELAAALHARVPHRALVGQILLETLAWALAGALLAAPVLGWVAQTGPSTGLSATWLVGLRIVAAAAASALVGAVLAVLAVREKHLFRWFKAR